VTLVFSSSAAPPTAEYIDGTVTYTNAPSQPDPLTWVGFLGNVMTQRYQQTMLFDTYYRGDHPLPYAGVSAVTSLRHHYRRLLKESRSNWAELIVDAVNERLRVEGFRFSGNEQADLEVWSNVWQENCFDARSDEVHIESLVWGYSYAIVWPDDDGGVNITAEHPAEVICYAPAANRHLVSMALKRWRDDWGYWHATLYTPGAIYKFVSNKAESSMLPPRTVDSFVERQPPGEPWPLPNPFGVVPVVEFPNNPRMLTGGRSELAGGQTDIMDRINETVFNRMLAAQFAAFRQKWVTGMEIPRDESGNPIEPFKVAVDRLWMTENPDAKFGEFDEATLQNYIGAAESDIQALASISRTPSYYLLPHGPMPSGEALKAAETGLVNKVKRRQRFFGESWEQMVRLALLMMGDPRYEDTSCETIWADPESRSDAQTADALVKLAQIGVPAEMLWERAGFSPQQISRMQAQRADEALLFGQQQLLPTPVPLPPAAPTGGTGA
jgi:hypothetical protein